MQESRYNVWVERGDGAYVYNGLSGALLRASPEDRQGLRAYLERGDREGVRPALLIDMARGRMLLPDEVDERDLLAARYQASREDTGHLAFTLVTSLGCNFDCPYCFEAKHPSIMDDEVQAAILQLLDDKLPALKSFHVTWFGGEPLVGKVPLLNLADRFVERCDAAGVDYSSFIVTNGYLLDEEMCRQLRDRRVGGAQVCLDGPPETHDRMRPLAGGGPSFWKIVENLQHAVDYLSISIRMNVDRANVGRAEELLQILADRGFSGKLTVNLGQLVGVDDGVMSPSSSYRGCMTTAEFADAEIAFAKLAQQYGLNGPSVPVPSATPCTAVRANELVIGSKGELYKCWESVGNQREVIGDIRNYRATNDRLRKWLNYDPFKDSECRSCVALPVCMGGCAHHAMDLLLYQTRCDTFRHNYQERVLSFVELAESGELVAAATGAPAIRRMDRR